MRLYIPVDLTGNLIMIEKLVLGEIWTGDLLIFNPDALTSVPSRQAKLNDTTFTRAPVCSLIMFWWESRLIVGAWMIIKQAKT